jgi:hypothetical protein
LATIRLAVGSARLEALITQRARDGWPPWAGAIQTAGELAGYWIAILPSGRGEDLIAAGLMLISGPVDGDELMEAVKVGYERGKGNRRARTQAASCTETAGW